MSKSKYADSVRRARHPHRPHHGQDPRAPASTRTRWCSTPPTTAPGRTSIPTPATRRSAAPRARCAKAATVFRPSPGCRARSQPGSKNHEIVGGLDLMATFASVAGVKLPENDREGQPIIFDSFDMSPVLFGTRQVAAHRLVLFHRERAVARRGPRRQLQGRVQPARRRRRRRPAASRSTPTSAGRAPRNTSPPCRRCSTSGRTRRSATTSS